MIPDTHIKNKCRTTTIQDMNSLSDGEMVSIQKILKTWF